MRVSTLATVSFLALATGFVEAQQPSAPWTLERQDRWGTGQAVTGPSSHSTPWISTQLSTDFPMTFRQNGPGASGQYTLSLKVSHWLRRDVDIDLRGGQANGVVFDLINGDVNGDNNINLADLLAISAAWRSTPGSAKWNPNADLNGDGKVNLADWLIVSKNWRKAGDP